MLEGYNKFWIARDKDGMLRLFCGSEDPIKGRDCWYCNLAKTNFILVESGLFPEVRWEDENPTKVELKMEDKQ